MGKMNTLQHRSKHLLKMASVFICVHERKYKHYKLESYHRHHHLRGQLTFT